MPANSNGEYLPRNTDSTPPVTYTEQPSQPSSTYVPSWLPHDFFTALQSASYILVLIGGWVAWSSKAWVKNLIDKHFSLIETLRNESAKNLELTKEQRDTIDQLTENNNRLTMVVSRYIIDQQKLKEVVQENHNILESIRPSVDPNDK